MSNCEKYRYFISVLNGGIKDYLFSKEIISERDKNDTKRINVRIDRSDFIIIHKDTNAVKELMIKSDLADGAIMDLLTRIGLRDIASTMIKRGYVPRSVTMSYVIPSRALYLLIEGVRGRVPTVRVSVRENNYEASASYCVIYEGEDVCTYLKELITIVTEMRNCIITYAQ